MRKVVYYFKELLSFCNKILDYAIWFIGLWLVVYGIVILIKVFVRHESMLLTTEQLFLAGAGIIFLFGFVVAVIVAAIKTVKEDALHEIKDTKNKGQNVITTIPSVNIEIKSRDIRRMSANQIKLFFKGTKQGLVEYRKALKETHKYEQEIAKKQSAKERKTEIQ